MLKNRLLTYSILLFLCFMNVKAYASNEALEQIPLLNMISTLANDQVTDRIHLKSTDVKVNINGSIADVTVRQQYQNNGDRILSGQYTFPAPARGLIHGMQMTTDEKVFTASVKEQETARAEYSQFIEEGKNALLIKQDRPDLFSINLANVMPGETVDVELNYTELLIPTDTRYEFVYPGVSDQGYSDQLENEFNIEVNLSAGVPIQQVMCDTHDIDTIFKTDSIARVIIKDQDKNIKNRNFIMNYQLKEKKIPAGLILSGGDGEKFLLLNEYVGSPGLKDITVKFTDLKTYDLEPSEIPDLSERKPVTLLAKYKGEADGLLKVEGRRIGGDYSKTYRLVKKDSRRTNDRLKHLWAGQRIGRLSDYNSDDKNRTKTDITNLGLKYKVLTGHTSLLAYNDVLRKRIAPAVEAEQSSPLPEEEPKPEQIRIAKVPEPGFYILLLILTSIVLTGNVRRKAVKIFSRICSSTLRSSTTGEDGC